MAGRKRIGLREVRALKPGETVWDTEVRGFGARRQIGDAVAYVLKSRTVEGRQRWHTIGRHGAPWTPDMARIEARRLLVEVTKGGDPAADKQARRRAETVDDLCTAYWADAATGRLLTRRRTPKKITTLASDKGRIEKHIKPLLGSLKVAAVTRDDVETFMHAVAEGKTAARVKTGKTRGLSNVRGGIGTASRTVGLLGAIFAYAVRCRMRADNPVHGVMRPADGKRERRLSDAEYAALGTALRRAEAANVWPAAVAAVRFLVLTGWRSGEALGLRWADVDFGRRTATLADTKTGRSMRPLSHAACGVLRDIVRGMDLGLVFPPTRGAGKMAGFRKFWDRIAKLGELPADVTPHVLRHSFASLASDVGFSEATIAALLGHAGGRGSTSRYVHSADAVLLAAADAVAQRTLELMGELPKPVPGGGLMMRPIRTEAEVPEAFDAAEIKHLAELGRLPAASCDLQKFGEGVRTAVRIYARDEATPSLKGQQTEIRMIAQLIERTAHVVSAYEELAQALESLDPTVHHMWALRQANVEDRMPSWRVPEPSELRDPATRECAAQDLKALITIGGSWTEGRMRPSGRRSRTWWSALQTPVKIAGKRQPRQDAAHTLVMNLQVAMHEAGVAVPLTAHHTKPGPFARMVAEVLLIVGAAGRANAVGLAVQIINDLQKERRARQTRIAAATN